MLVLSRKKGQSVLIGDNVEVILIDIRGDRVKLGFQASKEVTIVRREILKGEKDGQEG